MQSESPTANALLTSLIQEIRQVNDKLDIIIDFNRKMLSLNKDHSKKPSETRSKDAEFRKQPDAISLLYLPASLRQTIIALYKLEKATADELAAETKRLRAVESAAANQLVRMGYLRKSRKGRDVYFYIDASETKQ